MPKVSGSGRRMARKYRVGKKTRIELESDLRRIKELLEKLLSKVEISDSDSNDYAEIVADMADPRLVIFDLIRNHTDSKDDHFYVDQNLDRLIDKRGEWVRAYAISGRVYDLVDCLRSEDESIRLQASKCLAGIGPSVIPALDSVLHEATFSITDSAKAKQMEWIAVAATSAICNMDFGNAPPQLLLDLVTNSYPEVRRLAVKCLADFDSEQIVDLFDAKASMEKDSETCETMSLYLWEHERPEHVLFLMDEFSKSISRPKTEVQYIFLKKLCENDTGTEVDYDRINIAKRLLSKGVVAK